MYYRDAGQFKTTYAEDSAIFPIIQDRWMICIGVVAAFCLPVITSDYWLTSILLPLLIFSIAAIGLNILVGYAGQLSLGTGGFMAVGAFAAYNLAIRLPFLNYLVVFVLAGLIAALVGTLFGLPSLRIKGFYLAVATLASQFLIEWILVRVPWLTNYSSSGVVSAPPMMLFGHHIESPASKYLLALSIAVVAALAAKNLVRGPIGRSWMAIRDMDIAAEIIGVRPLRAKLLAFAVSSFFCGLAGALWVFLYIGTIEPQAFDLHRSFQVLFMVIIGGLGTILGAFVGAAFVVFLPIALSNASALIGGLPPDVLSNLELIIYGCVIITLLIGEPLGLARLWSLGREKLRIWPFPY